MTFTLIYIDKYYILPSPSIINDLFDKHYENFTPELGPVS